MDNEDPALESLDATALVRRVIDDIDEGGEEQQDALLCELLYVAWGSLWAQNQ